MTHPLRAGMSEINIEYLERRFKIKGWMATQSIYYDDLPLNQKGYLIYLNCPKLTKLIYRLDRSIEKFDTIASFERVNISHKEFKKIIKKHITYTNFK